MLLPYAAYRLTGEQRTGRRGPRQASARNMLVWRITAAPDAPE
jgi:hypothetical protein